jgi:hypothetical protein
LICAGANVSDNRRHAVPFVYSALKGAPRSINSRLHSHAASLSSRVVVNYYAVEIMKRLGLAALV